MNCLITSGFPPGNKPTPIEPCVYHPQNVTLWLGNSIPQTEASMNSPTAESSDTAITTAINTHADAKEKWLALRQQYEQIATEFEQSLKQLKEPAAEQCPIESRIALLRRQMEILKWEINCTANSYISAHRDLMHTGIKTELGSFMASHGEALVSALSPLLLRLKDITQIASYEAVLDTAAQY